MGFCFGSWGGLVVGSFVFVVVFAVDVNDGVVGEQVEEEDDKDDNEEEGDVEDEDKKEQIGL